MLQRINRRLAKDDDEQLKRTRGSRWRSDLGEFYIIDVNRNATTAKDVDPEELGQELGVLKQWERVEDSAT